MHEFEADCVVAGAGVVGLAIARALAMAGRDVIIVDRADMIGSETSARNSEVIHAGIYYPRNSLKAEGCVAGKHALYTYLQERGLPHKRCEKLIVATDEKDEAKLESIRLHASANGVEDLELLTATEVGHLEPDLSVKSALRSPSTGILDSHAYMLSLLGDAEDHGAQLALKTPIVRGRVLGDGRTELDVEGDDPCRITTKLFVNSAGHGAPQLARSIEGLDASVIPQEYYAKGNYFSLSSKAPFQRLIYPVPVPGGLGVHLTLDLGGRAKFGPDVEWIDEMNYDVDPARGDSFYDAVRKYWPGLKDGALQPDYAGIRPKIVGPGEGNADFMLLGPDQCGADGQVHLFGIESPGLTSSLELARRVADLV